MHQNCTSGVSKVTKSLHHRDTKKQGHAARVTSFLYIIITSRLPTRHRNDRLFCEYRQIPSISW